MPIIDYGYYMLMVLHHTDVLYYIIQTYCII